MNPALPNYIRERKAGVERKGGVKPKAYTLTELLIIVVIIGILATITFPNMIGMQMKAKLKEVENTVGVISAAIKIYYFKTGNWPESAWWDWNAATRDTGYVDSGGNNIEAILNISLPKGAGAMCLYRFNRSVPMNSSTYNNCVVFAKPNPLDRQGLYSLDTDQYVIENGKEYERYLEYLE